MPLLTPERAPRSSFLFAVDLILSVVEPPPGQHGNVSCGRVLELSHERDEQIRGSGGAEEGVVEQLGRGRPLGGVADQHLVQEALEARSDLKRKMKMIIAKADSDGPVSPICRSAGPWLWA